MPPCMTPEIIPFAIDEEEIVDWVGLEPNEFSLVNDHPWWSLQNRYGCFHNTSVMGIDGMIPSPRVNDGITVWVWELNK